MKVIIYMPALNEETDIQHVIQCLPRALDRVDSIEVVVIDDGSTDQTAAIARASGAQVVSHGRNRGVGAAFHSAVRYALEHGGDLLVGIDADRQFDPEEIPALIQPLLDDKAEMVIGNRFADGIPAHMPRLKYWGNNQVSNLIRIASGQTFRDVSCGFRAYNREALLRMNIFGEFTYTHETILSLAYQGLRVVEHPICVKYDPQRKSRVAGSILRYAVQTSKIMVRVMLDYRPMRMFGGVAAGFILVGIACELFLLGHYALRHSYTPYKAVGFIGLGFVVFGMLVMLIALIADMLNRLRMNQDQVLYQLKKMRYEK